MIIDDARFAAAYTTTTGDVRRFDDIGDMLLHSQQHQEEIHIYWVHDYETTDWINADQAILVLSPNLTTPMAWGVAAFAEPGAAEAFSHYNQGHMTNFRDLWADMESGALDPKTINAHAHDDPAGESLHNMEMESMNHDHQTKPADGG
jgi:copper chaperone NosL